jgi:hypothetical protein
MDLKRLFPGLRKERDPLEGSFNDALFVFGELPTTCKHLVDYSCGRGRVTLPESLAGFFGADGSQPEVEVFVAAHQSNDALKRKAVILVEVGKKRTIFRVKGTSSIEEVVQETDWEQERTRIITNQRSIFLTPPKGKRREVLPGTEDFRAFRQLWELTRRVKIAPMELRCNGCTPKEYGLPRPEI